MKIQHFLLDDPKLKDELQNMLFTTSSGYAAKCIGKTIPEEKLRNKRLHDSWNLKKYPLMKIAILHKAKDSQEFRRVLLFTGSIILHEMVGKPNYWNWPGKDAMGLLLMDVRHSIHNSTIQADILHTISNFEIQFHESWRTRRNRRTAIAKQMRKKKLSQ